MSTASARDRGARELRDTHTVITGAPRGIGAALAREFASRGSRVTVLARNAESLKAVAAETDGTAMTVDLAEDLDGLVDRIEDLGGPIDVLVNNAAVVIPGSFAGLSGADVRMHVKVNLQAPMELCAQVIPKMLERERGAIVTISSLLGEISSPNTAPYAASKAGLTHFTENLRRELRRTPIHVLLAILGVVETDMMLQTHEDPVLTKIAGRLGRIGSMTSQDVAERIVTALEQQRPSLVLPKLVGPTYHLRQLPTRLTDVLMMGIR